MIRIQLRAGPFFFVDTFVLGESAAGIQAMTPEIDDDCILSTGGQWRRQLARREYRKKPIPIEMTNPLLRNREKNLGLG